MEPLPPVKEVEYRCYIGKMFEELSGREFITFGFETAKEFSSFRYEIAVRYRIQLEPPTERRLEFKVLGMTATRTMMPAFGTARSVLKLPILPLGVYTVKMIKSDGSENIFTIEVTKKGMQILAPVPRKRFIDLVVEESAALQSAKNLSTISKTPPPPLIPRTIQKRQPPPLTPEEQAILDSLRSETPEERDAREEAELFGRSSSKPAAKKPEPAKPANHSTAKHAPAKAVHVAKHAPAKPAAKNGKAKPAAKPAPKKAAKPTKPIKKAAPKAKAKPAAKAKPKKAAKKR